MVALDLAQADGPLHDHDGVLTFSEGATDGTGVFDAIKLTPAAGAYILAALGDASALQAVESRPAPTTGAVSVPLHVALVGAGERLVLSWPVVEALPETWAAALTDMQTGTTVDLRTATEYAFTVTAAPAGESGTAAVFALDAPAPNPARGQAALAYSLAEAGAAGPSVVDLLGREVAVLAEGEQAAGRHTTALEVSGLAPGVYVVRLSVGAQTATRRVVVVRQRGSRIPDRPAAWPAAQARRMLHARPEAGPGP